MQLDDHLGCIHRESTQALNDVAQINGSKAFQAPTELEVEIYFRSQLHSIILNEPLKRTWTPDLLHSEYNSHQDCHKSVTQLTTQAPFHSSP